MTVELVSGARVTYGPSTGSDATTSVHSNRGAIKTLEVVCSASDPAVPSENDIVNHTIPEGSLLLSAYTEVLEAITFTADAAVAVVGTDISAAATDDSFNSVAGDFDTLIDAGAAPGRFITVAGFTGEVANNDTWEIVTITASKIVVDGALTDDAAGESVTITLDRLVAEEVAIGFSEPDGTLVDADAIAAYGTSPTAAGTWTVTAINAATTEDRQVHAQVGDPFLDTWATGKVKIRLDYLPPN